MHCTQFLKVTTYLEGEHVVNGTEIGFSDSDGELQDLEEIGE